MLWHIAWFEIRYWLRSWMLWIFTLLIAAMIFGAVSSDQVQVGGALSNTLRNAPFVIQNYYALIGLLTLLMATAFVNSAAKGNETEVPVNDWIDIGAFAKPEKGRKYGRTLYRDRVHIAQTRSTYTFTVGELPDQAGVDPFLLLIDRLPEDNVKKVTLAPEGK